MAEIGKLADKKSFDIRKIPRPSPPPIPNGDTGGRVIGFLGAVESIPKGTGESRRFFPLRFYFSEVTHYPQDLF